MLHLLVADPHIRVKIEDMTSGGAQKRFDTNIVRFLNAFHDIPYGKTETLYGVPGTTISWGHRHGVGNSARRAL